MIADNCNKCEICKYTIKKCDYRGTNNPVLYFVGESPGPQERVEGRPFVGRAGKYLFNIIDQFGLNDNNCRFWNTVLCYPAVSAENNKFRAPTMGEMNNCKHYVIEDIIKTKPKVIVTLGSSAIKAFMNDEKLAISKIRGTKIFLKLDPNSDEEYLIVPTYHPSYLMRNPDNKKNHDEFKSDIKFAMSLSIDRNFARNDEEDNNDNDGEYRNCPAKTIEIRTFKEFHEFCRKYIDSTDRVGYDVETNAKEVHSIDHRVVGFSLSPNKDIGCYVIFDSLDYTMNDRDKRLIEKELRKILSSKTVLVYNSQHELPVTLNWLDLDFSRNFEDLFIKVKLMNSDAISFK